MKRPNKFKHFLKRLYSNKILKRLAKPFPRYGKAVNAVVLLAFVMLVVAGAAALTVHNKPTPITTSPTSSTDSNDCLLSSSGCPSSQSSNTATPAPTQNASTQPAQTTTPSTTAKPKSSTSPTSYPAVVDGMVWTSPTCHYAAGYGEAYYRDTLVQSLQTQQSSTASMVSGTINQYNENGLSTSQETLSTVNSYITTFNNFVSTTYSQYVSEVNSIGCATTIDTTNIPQVPACTDLSGTVCDDGIWAISIPSLE